MVHREEDKQFFLPFKKISLQKPFLQQSAVLPEKKYRLPGKKSSLVKLLTEKFFKKLGEETNNLYALEDTLEETRKEWQPILDFLHRENVIGEANISIEPIYNDEPRFYSLRLPSAPFDSAKTDGHRISYSSFSRGVSFDFPEALSKVVGEQLERFPFAFYRRQDFLLGSADDLRRKKMSFLDLRTLAGFSEEQKAKHMRYQFGDKTNFFWAEARRLSDNKPFLIPAQLIFWNYCTHQEPIEPLLREANTNGTGAYFTKTGAILSGLRELIQRDHFLIYWLNQNPPPRVDLNSLDNLYLNKIRRQCERYGFDLTILDVTADLEVPVFFAALKDRYGGVYFGGGCESTAELAITRAVSEVLGIYHWIREYLSPLSPYNLPENYEPFETEEIDQKTRVLFWANPHMLPEMKWMFSGPISPLSETARNYRFSNGEAELEHLLKLLRNKGQEYEIYTYEPQWPVLKTLGFHSVKVIVPALIPFYLTEARAPLGAKRLREIPDALDFGEKKFPNPLPHPFP